MCISVGSTEGSTWLIFCNQGHIKVLQLEDFKCIPGLFSVVPPAPCIESRVSNRLLQAHSMPRTIGLFAT